MRRPLIPAILVSLALAGSAGDAAAACANTGSFERWLSDFKAEARSKGVSARALSALDGVTLDQGVINSDRGQKVFSQTFLEFSDRMAAKYRIEKGRALIQKHKAIFSEIDRRFGLPARSSWPIGRWRRISARTTAIFRRFARWPRSPTIAAGPRNFTTSCSTRCASWSAATLGPTRCGGRGLAKWVKRSSCRPSI